MRRVIRRGTFETNSSSTHTLAIFTEDAFKEWIKSGEKYAYINTKQVINKLYTFDEVKERALSEYSEYEFQQAYEEEGDGWLGGEFDYCTPDYWYQGGFETENTTFQISTGENVVVACRYGYM